MTELCRRTPFPFGPVSLGLAVISAACTSWWIFISDGYHPLPSLAASLGWLGFGLAGVTRRQWKGFAAGFPVMLAPPALWMMTVGASISAGP